VLTCSGCLRVVFEWTWGLGIYATDDALSHVYTMLDDDIIDVRKKLREVIGLLIESDRVISETQRGIMELIGRLTGDLGCNPASPDRPSPPALTLIT
jgi:hypothetical protein